MRSCAGARIRSYAEAWVVRVAGNLAIDAWRRLQRVETNADAESRGATAPGPDGQRVDLHRALDTLSRRQREVLVLRFLADLPEADVAKVLGCSVGSVKQHASRGLATLRTSMAVDDAGRRPGAPLMPNFNCFRAQRPAAARPGRAGARAVAARAHEWGAVAVSCRARARWHWSPPWP